MSRQLYSSGLLPIEKRSVPICVVGAGAIGGTAVMCLAKMGFTHITVVDFDEVAEHNVDNQPYYPRDIGTKKVDALSIYASNTGIFLNTNTDRFENIPDVLKHYANGILVVAVDSMDVRKIIWDRVVEMYNQTFQWPNLYLDARMGAEFLSLYSFHPALRSDKEAYEKELFPSSEAVQAPCTEKSIYYTSLFAGGLVCSQIKKYLIQDQLKFETVLDISALGKVFERTVIQI